MPELVNLARLYGTKPQRLIRPDHLPKLPPSMRAALSHDDSPVPHGRTLEFPTTDVANEVDDMHRRALLNVVAAVGVGAALPMDRLETLRLAIARATGLPDSAEDWRYVAEHYAVTVGTTPPARLLADALTDLAEISQLVKAGHPERTMLLDVSAQLSAYVAMSLIEMGETRTAFRWWANARQAADQAGRVSLRAWVRARAGADLLYACRMPDAARRTADEAVGIAGRQPSPGLAEAQVLRAGSLAKQGDPAARDALDDLRRTFDALPEDVTRAANWAGFGERRVREVESSVHLWLNDPAAARAAIERTLELYPPDMDAAAAKSQLHVATCLVLDGDVTAGIAHATNTLHRLPFAAESVRRRGNGVLDALPEKASSLPAARELRELIAA